MNIRKEFSGPAYAPPSQPRNDLPLNAAMDGSKQIWGVDIGQQLVSRAEAECSRNRKICHLWRLTGWLKTVSPASTMHVREVVAY